MTIRFGVSSTAFLLWSTLAVTLAGRFETMPVAWAARCNPNGICNACSNCSSCGHCAGGGGSCSVCSGGGSSRSFGGNSDSYSSPGYSPRYRSYEPPAEVYVPPTLTKEQADREYHRRLQPQTRYLTPPAAAPPSRQSRARPARAASPLPRQFSGQCVSVSDGDTVSVMHAGRAVKVRLYGIDCPEKGQPFGTQAKKFTSERAFGKVVTVYSKGQDRYGRTLGWVFAGKECINRSLVASGLAWWYSQYSPTEQKLAALEKAARADKKGLWSDCCAVAPWNWRRGGRPPKAEPHAQKSEPHAQATSATAPVLRPQANVVRQEREQQKEFETANREAMRPVMVAGAGAGAVIIMGLGLVALRRKKLA